MLLCLKVLAFEVGGVQCDRVEGAHENMQKANEKNGDIGVQVYM
jgi:hypothetical protein